jgi:hypothetical protein
MSSAPDLLWADIDNEPSLSTVEITVGPKPKHSA